MSCFFKSQYSLSYEIVGEVVTASGQTDNIVCIWNTGSGISFTSTFESTLPTFTYTSFLSWDGTESKFYLQPLIRPRLFKSKHTFTPLRNTALFNLLLCSLIHTLLKFIVIPTAYPPRSSYSPFCQHEWACGLVTA